MESVLTLCQGLPERRFAAGEVILTEGERTGRLFVLIEGEVEILKGPYQVHVASEPGAVFGEISALLDIPHTATARTTAPTRAYVVDTADAFLRSHQELAYWVSKLLAQRLHGMTTYLVDLKAQFEDQDDHLGMVEEVLGALLHQQDEGFVPGSDRHPDTKL
jgi:CRP-like cAMP-binding protein